MVIGYFEKCHCAISGPEDAMNELHNKLVQHEKIRYLSHFH